MSDLPVLCGIVGAILACGAYWAHLRRFTSYRAYAWLNLASCGLIAVSLVDQFNVATLLIEVFFALVSIQELCRGKDIWGCQ